MLGRPFDVDGFRSLLLLPSSSDVFGRSVWNDDCPAAWDFADVFFGLMSFVTGVAGAWFRMAPALADFFDPLPFLPAASALPADAAFLPAPPFFDAAFAGASSCFSSSARLPAAACLSLPRERVLFAEESGVGRAAAADSCFFAFGMLCRRPAFGCPAYYSRRCACDQSRIECR